ncbi:L-2-amino-thiazoline-4-carboxylic acid hydrolase [Denitrobaculum tricleocarpae]|uniref:L-2-amino-thiazoline-4-carboxylic acid hydrolase n=1 Tax=Denitrobaculum tricleocarpae TaxID=2591009 RepID=UPI0015D27E1E|nr:L-2-amino-thiazoline-4-carboxylic acid hydrolase [Denitrobaculum tricleocarpae]
MNRPQGHPDVYGAIKERGLLYVTTFRELRKRYGEEEAISIMRSVSHAHGVQVGTSMAQFGPRDFEGICKAWVLSPENGATFRPDIRRLDELGIEVKMTACPIKDAWVDSGCSDEEICTLLYCASAYDRAALETAGFACEIELWSPGKDGCCLTRITEKS